MPLHDISHNERLEDVGEILIALLLQWIRVRAGHTAGSRVLIEVAVDLALVAIESILLKREWENLDLKRTPRKERRQIARQQKGIRSGVELLVMVDDVLKGQGIDSLRRKRHRHRGEQTALERCQMRGKDDAIG